MPDNTIDTLRLEVESEASNASEGLDRLTKSLLGLSDATSRGQSGLANYAKQIKAFADSAAKLKDLKFPDISSLIPQGNGENLNSLAMGMSALAQSTRDLASVRLGDVSKSITRLERLGGANIGGLVSALQPLNGLDLSNLSNLGNAMNGFISSLAGAEKVSTGTSKIFTALAQLASSAGNITVVQQTLPGLSTVIRSFIGEMANAPAVDAGTVSIVSALSGIASSGTQAQKASKALPEITVAVKEFVNALAKAPALNDNVVKAVQALSQLSNAGGRAGTAAKSLNKNITSLSSSMLNLRKSSLKAFSGMKSFARQILSAVGAVGGLYAAVRGIRASLDISSDLTEVQNVVDVTFGDMAQKLEQLTDTSIVDFGLSELTAKKISSRFQAMGVAMGFAQDEMSDMSIELTKLAADMASFYNVSQEDVAQDLEAVFTGMTRPLRTYGIDLTQATLQEWALSQGMNANIKSMTQAEKTLLRYNYVMAHTGAAQGDFARTSGTWANQLRILAQSFQALGAIIGEVLINAFKPFVAALNSVMQKVIQFARTVANALGAIFGWKLEINTGGITNDIGDLVSGTDDVEDNADGVADGLGDAAKNAKKLKDYVLGIDELNIIHPDEDEESGTGKNGGAGGGIGGLGDLSGAAEAELVKTEGLFDKYKSDIDTLYELGAYIGKVLADAMNDIDWEAIYEKARNFGKGLADFLNGLISPELFGALGRTIAGALNTALYALNSFGHRFDWTDFGLSIAEGINEFFKSFKFDLLADTINTWANGILDTMITAVRNIEWRMIGEKIGDFLVQIDFLEIGKKIGTLIWEAIKAGLDIWNGMFDVAPIETTIITAFGAIKLTKLAQPIIKQLSSIVKAFQLATKAIAGNQAATVLLSSSYPKLAQTLSNVAGVFSSFKNTLALTNDVSASLGAAFSTLQNSLSVMAKGVIGVAAAFLEFNFVKDNIEQLILGTDNLVGSIVQIGVAVAGAGAAFSLIFGFPAGLIATALVGLVAAIIGVKSAFDEIQEGIVTDSIANALQNPGGVPIEQLSDKYVIMADTITAQFDAINEKSAELETTRDNIQQAADSMEPYVFAIQNGAQITDESVTAINEDFNRLLTESSSLLEQESLIVYQALAGSLGEAVVAAGGSIDEYIAATERLKTDSQKQLDEISESLSQLRTDYENNIITQEEYATSMMGLIERYNDLTGKGTEVESTISEIRDVVSAGIDWTAVTYQDGTLNVSALTNEIEKVGTSFTNAKETVSLSGQEIVDTINSLIEQAQATGDTEAETALTQLLKYQEEEMNRQIGEIDRLDGEYTQILQDDLVNKIPEIVDSIEEPDWGRKLLGATKEGDIQAAISEFESSTIKPVEQAIQGNFETLGESGYTYASTAIEKTLDGLFDYGNNTDSTSRWDSMRKTLTTDVNGAVSGALEDAKEMIIPNAEAVGTGVGEGFNTGVENSDFTNSLKSKNEESVEAMRDVWDTHSPSKVAENIALDIGQGFNNGIARIDSATAITNWMEQTKSLLSVDRWATLFDGIPQGFQLKWTELSTWISANTESMFSSLKNVLSVEKWAEVFENIQLAFQMKWDELVAWWSGTAIVGWWEEGVMPWFTVEKWTELLLNVYTAFELQFTEIFNLINQTWLDTELLTTETWTRILEFYNQTFESMRLTTTTVLTAVQQLITTSLTAISNLINTKLTEIKSKWDSTWVTFPNVVESAFSSVRGIAESTVSYILELIGQLASSIAGIMSSIGSLGSALSGAFSGIPSGINLAGGISLNIPGFAGGGMPEKGSLFWANENNKPELVGEIGGRTSVANNDMITRAIEEAAYRGFTRANSEDTRQQALLEELISAVREGKVIEIDGREIVSVVNARTTRNGYAF